MPIDYDISMTFVKRSFLDEFSEKVEKLGYQLLARDEYKNGKEVLIATVEYISWNNIFYKNGTANRRKKLEELIPKEFSYQPFTDAMPEIFPVRLSYLGDNK